MDTGAGGESTAPDKIPDQERFQNLSLIDSISYLLLATELDRDVVQSYLATPATPANGLLQPGPARDACETC